MPFNLLKISPRVAMSIVAFLPPVCFAQSVYIAQSAETAQSAENPQSDEEPQSAKTSQNIQNNNVERYTVTATRPYYDETLSRIFPQYQFDKANLVSPLHTNDILLQSPSVSLNGQSGQIQSINIRGYSRWRIQTLLDGVPIVSDRRAGSSIGFVPPDFISSVSVLPGAASTYLGSGALGGAVNLLLSDTPTPYVRMGYSSNQQMKALSYADTSNDKGKTDWNMSLRSANNGEDANGNTLFDEFEQTALFVRHQPKSGVIKEVWTLYTDNKDIGKSSSDFPESRVTTYPKNTHWLGKLSFAAKQLSGGIWWHQSSLDTTVLRPQTRINESENSAFDYGFDIKTQSEWQDWLVNWQLQVSGREGIVADEAEFSLMPSSTGLLNTLPARSFNPELAFETRTLNASEINTAGIVDASNQWGRFSIAVGGRVDWQRQSNNDVTITGANTSATATSKATNLSGYIGTNYQLSNHWAVSVYVSSAFRNPSLTERFFAGETPRGKVLGSTALETEQAINTQASLAYSNKYVQGSVDMFYQHINDYIERISIADDVLQYANLNSATIKGVSYQLNWQSREGMLDARLSGMWMQGEDNKNMAIADIPANNQRLDVGLRWHDTRFFTVLAYRASKSDIADGERALDDLFTLDVGASWQFNERTQFQVSWSNLTNQHFYTSADDKAAFAQGESVQLALTYLL
ncbi:TonB-dependent receptor [Alteromonas gracilis]|uniref:TonB-dependent receptor n=1 Tax=Alteromonas gracilis TaxID=1479524 RepID=UPI003734F9F5